VKSPLSAHISVQGGIEVESITVLSETENLVVLCLNTREKYVEAGADVFLRSRKTIGHVLLSEGERTLRATSKEPTIVRIEGLRRSNMWSAATETGRYSTRVILYRTGRSRGRGLALEST